MARWIVNFFRLSSSDQALLIQAALAVVNAASFLYAPVAYDKLLMSLGEDMPRTSMSKRKADDDYDQKFRFKALDRAGQPAPVSERFVVDTAQSRGADADLLDREPPTPPPACEPGGWLILVFAPNVN